MLLIDEYRQDTSTCAYDPDISTYAYWLGVLMCWVIGYIFYNDDWTQADIGCFFTMKICKNIIVPTLSMCAYMQGNRVRSIRSIALTQGNRGGSGVKKHVDLF